MFRYIAGKCSGSEQESVQIQSRKVFRFRAGKCSGLEQESVLCSEQESVQV